MRSVCVVHMRMHVFMIGVIATARTASSERSAIFVRSHDCIVAIASLSTYLFVRARSCMWLRTCMPVCVRVSLWTHFAIASCFVFSSMSASA